jgi:hypothetical protein
MLSEADLINMLVFVIDNLPAMFDGCVLQQTVGMHMGTHCPPFLADLWKDTIYIAEREIKGSG